MRSASAKTSFGTAKVPLVGLPLVGLPLVGLPSVGLPLVGVVVVVMALPPEPVGLGASAVQAPHLLRATTISTPDCPRRAPRRRYVLRRGALKGLSAVRGIAE